MATIPGGIRPGIVMLRKHIFIVLAIVLAGCVDADNEKSSTPVEPQPEAVGHESTKYLNKTALFGYVTIPADPLAVQAMLPPGYELATNPLTTPNDVTGTLVVSEQDAWFTITTTVNPPPEVNGPEGDVYILDAIAMGDNITAFWNSAGIEYSTGSVEAILATSLAVDGNHSQYTGDVLAGLMEGEEGPFQNEIRIHQDGVYYDAVDFLLSYEYREMNFESQGRLVDAGVLLEQSTASVMMVPDLDVRLWHPNPES